MSWPPTFLKVKENQLKPLIVNQIPRFVSQKNYAETFGDQWHYFPKTQLDSYTGIPISETRLKRCLGQLLWNNLQNKKVLEIGCGAGRFTEILLQQKALLVSVDLSHAVEVNKANFPVSDQHLIIQADVMKLPFEHEQFDVVVCLGVLQHTPNPQATIKKLAEQLKVDGFLVIDQYVFHRSYWSLRLLYRQIFKRLPPKVAFKTLKILSPLFLPLHRSFKGFRFLTIFLNRVSPFITYYRDIPELSSELQKEWALLDSFDTLTDWYKNFGSVYQLSENLKQNDLTVLRCELGGNGVEALAQKLIQ